MIDIISSVFNCDDFLEGYFIDLTNQTFFKHCKLTMVAPNPSNKLMSLYRIYSKLYPNITMMVPDKDYGISACLNLAIENTSAKYITIGNTDDRRRSDSIERHAIELELNPDVDLVYSRSLISTKPNETFDVHTCEAVYLCLPFDGLNGLAHSNSPHHNPMWRRSIHEKNGYFDTTLKSAADWDLWMKCVTNGSKFKMIDQILGIYYNNPNGMSTNLKDANERSAEQSMVRSRYIK